MAISRSIALVLGLDLCVLLAGCGGGASSNAGGGNGGGGGTPPVTPTISSISPTSVIAGAGPVTLTVNGTNFLSTSIVEVNGQSETTTFVSSTQLTAAIPAAQLTSGGSLAVVVLNGSLSSGPGTPVNLAVNNPSVGVLLLNPSVLPIGGTSPVTITLTGNTFVPASVVNVNGSPRASTYVNPTTLTFDATVADQAVQATMAVTVTNPAPGGGTSPVASLSIGVAQPTIASVSPNTFIVGSPDTPIAVSGTNFAPNSVVNWNGSALATSFYSYGGIQLNATIPAADLTTAGTAALTVSTAGVTSAPFQVSVTNPPVPTLTSISPTAGPIGVPVQVTLTGAGFTTNSTVTINGASIATTVVNSTELTVNVPASSLSLPGNLSFTVITPAPGGGTSAAVPFMAYIGVPNNSMVYDPANGLFYVSVPSSAGPPYGNSVVSVDPETGALGTPIAVGSEPDQLAISSDGTVLWVGLDGASAVREVDLTTGTAGLQFSLGGNGGLYQNPPKPLALAALPGSPNSVVVATQTPFTYEGTVAIFDSGVLRGTATNSTVNGIFYALLTDGTRSEIYAGGGVYQTYTYSVSGLTPLATGPSGFTYANYGSNEMQIAGGTLYTDYGQAFDSESGDLLGTFYVTGTTPAQGPTVADTTLGLGFILDNSPNSVYGSYQIQTFNLSNYTSTGNTIPISLSTSGLPGSGPSHLTRWGTNGLAFRTNIGVFSVRSNLVKDLSNVNADLSVALTASGGTTTGNNTTYTATITNNGPSASTNVALTAALPSTGVLVSATPSAGTCSTGSMISCDLGGLANGATSTVVFVVQETNAGTATMTVQTSGSENDSKLSNNTASASVAVTGSTYNLAPTLSAVSPAAIESGSNDTVITVTGTGFSSGATVLLGGTALPTTYSSNTELTATVPQSALTTLGWVPVRVSNPAPGGGTSNPVPLSVFNVITLGVNHILYDPYSRKIMASVGSGSTSITGNSIVAITPETATVGTPVPIGSQPTNLALTSDGQTLYTILTGSQSIAVFNMLTQSAEFTYQVQPSTGTDTNPDPRGIATQPGSESTVAIDLGSWAGNAIYSFDLTNKTAAMVGQASGPYSGSCLLFLDAADMLAFDTDTSGATLDHYTVTSAGFTYYDYSQYTESTLNGFGCFKLSGGLAFANAGGVANPATVPATQLGVFPVTGGGEFSTFQAFVPDTSLQSAFYLVDTSAGNANPGAAPDGIQTFNQNTFLPTSSVSLNMEQIEGTTSYSGVDVVRWGQDGLAILTTGGHIYFLRGAFVVPGLLGSNSAATLGSSSSSSIPHGAGNTLLTLTGSNFQPGIAVTWNGSYRTTTIVDATHLNVAIPATDLATAGTASVIATNPGGPASNTLTITIQ